MNSPFKQKLFLNWVVVALTIAFSPILLWLSVIAILNADTNVLGAADESSPVTQDFRRFSDLFDAPDFAIVTWPTEGWNDPMLVGFAEQLQQEDALHLFKAIESPASMIQQLEESSKQISRSNAISRITGTMTSVDQKRGCVLVSLSETGQKNRFLAMESIREAASQVGVLPNQLRIGGVAAELAWIEREGIFAPLRIIPAVAIACLVVCCLSLKSMFMGVLLNTLSNLSGLSILALMVLTGTPLDAINSTLPTLGLMLTASLGLHWYGYFYNATPNAVISAAKIATRKSILPASLSIMTTCLGMLSLILSKTSAIATFGYFGAASAMIAGAWAIVALPMIVELIPFQPISKKTGLRRRWIFTWRIIGRYRPGIILICSCCLLIATWGLRSLTTTIRLDGLFSSDHRATSDAQWIEDNLFPLSRMEVILTIRAQDIPDDSERLLAGMQMLREAVKQIRKEGGYGVPFSALHVLPKLPPKGGVGLMIKRRIYATKLEDSVLRLEELGMLNRNEDRDSWRISCQTSTLFDSLSSSQKLKARKLEECCHNLTSTTATPFTSMVTGVGLLMEEIEDQFFSDLVFTYIVAIVFVFIAVWLAFQSIHIACLAMFPNMFPPLMVLGLVGWTGVSLDVASVMTASIALGIVVDDTIHLLFGVRHSQQSGKNVDAAIRTSFLQSGPAILKTSVLGFCTLSLLGFSEFLPTARFGLLLAFMFALAVVGDLVLLPALMKTEWGKSALQHSRSQASSNGQ